MSSRRKYSRRSSRKVLDSSQSISRRARKYNRRGSRKAKVPRATTDWSDYVKAHFKNTYSVYRGDREHLSRAEHREYFAKTMRELSEGFPGERRQRMRRAPGESRKRYSRKPYGSRGGYQMKDKPRKPYSREPYGSRGKYKPRAGSRKPYSRKPYGSRGKYKPRPDSSLKSRKYLRRASLRAVGAEVDVAGIEVVGGRVGNRRQKHYSRRASRQAVGAEVDVAGMKMDVGVGSRKLRRKARPVGGLSANRKPRLVSQAVRSAAAAPAPVAPSRGLLGGLAEVVSAPIRALAGIVAPVSRNLTKKEKDKLRREKALIRVRANDERKRAEKEAAAKPAVRAEVRGHEIQTRGKGKGGRRR